MVLQNNFCWQPFERNWFEYYLYKFKSRHYFFMKIIYCNCTFPCYSIFPFLVNIHVFFSYVCGFWSQVTWRSQVHWRISRNDFYGLMHGTFDACWHNAVPLGGTFKLGERFYRSGSRNNWFYRWLWTMPNNFWSTSRLVTKRASETQRWQESWREM